MNTLQRILTVICPHCNHAHELANNGWSAFVCMNADCRKDIEHPGGELGSDVACEVWGLRERAMELLNRARNLALEDETEHRDQIKALLLAANAYRDGAAALEKSWESRGRGVRVELLEEV